MPLVDNAGNQWLSVSGNSQIMHCGILLTYHIDTSFPVNLCYVFQGYPDAAPCKAAMEVWSPSQHYRDLYRCVAESCEFIFSFNKPVRPYSVKVWITWSVPIKSDYFSLRLTQIARFTQYTRFDITINFYTKSKELIVSWFSSASLCKSKDKAQH